MWFTRVSLHNPVLATMMMLALVVLGLFSLQRLQVDQFPNIEFPVVVVVTEYPGAAPEIVETEVSRHLEEAINTVAGIRALSSRSYEGQSLVIAEFDLSMDARKAAEDVREKVASVRPTLRTEVKEPRVIRFDPASRAVWSLAVLPQPGAEGQAGLSAVELTDWAEQVLKRRLENVRGVGSVTVVGGARRGIDIRLDPKALEAYAIAPEQVAAAVRTETLDVPLGAIREAERERVVQIDARMTRPEDFGQIIVARRNGSAIRVGQVAQVADTAQEVESLALYNGARTLLLSVQKTQDENTIAIVDKLERTIRELAPLVPPGVRLVPIMDGSRQIRVSVDNVRATLLEGAALTVLIVFLFLNSWRSTVITGLTLPIALIGTFFFMQVLGFTINLITLMALSLCVGLLIDDAIVVRENIVRHVQMGKTSFAAALDGTQEIGLAVLATTLSIVAVFLPIGFMGGIIGKFFHEFGLTIVAAVAISMFVSFTLDPMLSSVWHDPSIAAHGAGAPSRSIYDRTLGRVTRWFDHASEALASLYQSVLRWSLGHRAATLLIANLSFVAAIGLMPLLGTDFVPKADMSETSLMFHTPAGSSLEMTEQRAREVEAVVRSMPEVRYTLTTINTGNAPGKIYASMYIRLMDRSQRAVSAEDLANRLRQRVRQIAGITVTHVGLLDPVGGQKQILFSLQGSDIAELERLSQQVQERLAGVPGLVDVESSAKPNRPTLDVQLQRDAASDLGLGVSAVGSALRNYLAGQTITQWRAPDDQTYDVTVRLSPAARADPAVLPQLPLVAGLNPDGSARVLRLGQVAEVVEASGPTQINRRDLAREVAITANTSGRTIGEVSADIRTALDQMHLPPGYSYKFSGSVKDMAEAFAYAVSALAMAVIFIYMILASQFRSFLQPLALMTALPLTLIGVVLALMAFGSALSMFSAIGIVMLMGLVTKNAILLVDFAIRARAEGQSRHEALLLAARVRLRPILMTTLAMIFGMVPLALATSEGAEMRAPMGQAVIGGVITSSLLTLVVVPVVYCYLDDLAQWWANRRRRPAPGGLPS